LVQNASAAYFAHPFYSANPSAGTVDIGDIAVAAFYFDHGITAPFLGTFVGPFTTTPSPGLTQYDPDGLFQFAVLFVTHTD
jgi:hypothetical protein